MATAQGKNYSMEIKLVYGQPEILALKYLTGKEVEGNYGPRVMFTAVDERKLWLDGEDASELEHALIDLRVRAGEDFIRVTKVRQPRGGGHSLRIERADEPGTLSAPRVPAQRDTRTEALLEKSVEMARASGPAAFITPRPELTVVPAPLTATLTRALCASVDAYIAAAEYARTKGLTVTLDVEFNAEDIRQSATSIMIEAFKRQGGAC